MFEIEHLLRLDTNWNSGEESNQNLRKDLLARVAEHDWLSNLEFKRY